MSVRDLTDEELAEAVRAAGTGDLRAFEELVRRYQERVTANCRYISGAPGDAEDLAQEVFVKAFFGLARFEGRAKFRTWIQRIKVNHCINFVKRKKGKGFVSIDEPGLEGAPGMQVEPRAGRRIDALSDRERISAVLDGMSDALRVPLVMRDMDGFAYQEIADELGIGLSAVKMRIKRGREEFRRLFEAAHDEADLAGVEAP